MVLPDDKKKSIYWDEKLNRYVNTEASEDPVSKIKPPPTFLPPQNSEPSQSTATTPTFTPSSTNKPTNADIPKPQPLPGQQLSDPSMPPVNAAPNRFSLKSVWKFY